MDYRNIRKKVKKPLQSIKDKRGSIIDIFYKQKINLAIDWMWQLTDQDTGNIPNLGANDGAQLLQLSGSDYRDFRPSIQFASVLFRGYCVYDDERCNEILKWLDISFKETPCKKTNKSCSVRRWR